MGPSRASACSRGFRKKAESKQCHSGGHAAPRPRPRDASWASWMGQVFPTQACGRMGARAGQAREPRGRQDSRSSNPTLLHPSGSQLPSGSAGVVPGRDSGMKRGRGHAVIAAALPESRLSLACGCGAGGFIKRASSSPSTPLCCLPPAMRTCHLALVLLLLFLVPAPGKRGWASRGGKARGRWSGAGPSPLLGKVRTEETSVREVDTNLLLFPAEDQGPESRCPGLF